MARGREIKVTLVGDSQSLEKAFDKAGRKGKQFDSSMGKATSSLKTFAKLGAAGAAVGGVALVTKGLLSSVSAAKEAQVAQVNLQQALKQSGNSYGKYGKQIDAAIQKTSKLAALDDEELSGVFANLVRSTGSVAKATKGMALAANIARARNISLSAATKIVEKAQLGQVGALKKVGVEANKVVETQEAVKHKYYELERTLKGGLTPAMKAQMDIEMAAAKAKDFHLTQTRAMIEANRKFAGAAVAYGKTAAGAQDKLGVAFENLQEKVGEKLLPVLTKFTLKLVEIVEWSERNWPKFSKAVTDAFDKIRPIVDGFKTYFTAWVKLIAAVIQGDWPKAWGQIDDVVRAELKIVSESLKLFAPKFYDAGTKLGDALAKGIVEGLFGGLPGPLKRVLLEAEKLQLGVTQARAVKAVGGAIAGKVSSGTSRSRTPRSYDPRGKTPTGIGHRARGGPVMPGVPYIVGERGPEMFVSRTPGSIIPNGGGGGSGTLIVPVYLNGHEIARAVLPEFQRMAKHGTAQQRGRYGGQNLSLT